jgi:hypothetical protein
MANSFPQPPTGFVIEQRPGAAPEPPLGFVLEPPGQPSPAYADALAAGSAASRRLQGGPGPSDMAAPGEWVTPGEGEGGVPIISDVLRSIYPLEENTVTGDFRPAVPKAITGAIKSLGDAFTAPHDALAGDMSSLEVDPVTGAVAPFNSDMIERSVNAAGWATGGAPGQMQTFARNAAGKVIPKPIIRAASADGVPLSTAATQVDRLGPDAVLADLGPNLRAQAAAVAAQPGAQSADALIDTMSARKAGAGQRVRDGLDQTIGEAPIPSQLQADITAAKRVVGPEYDKALAAAPPVDLSGLADVIDGRAAIRRGPAQAALRDVRSMLNGADGELETSAAVLHQIREAVDGMLENPADGKTRKVLKDVRAEINDLLTEAVPDIQAIDSKYRELSRQSEAVDRGQVVLDSNRSAPRPVELAAEMQAGALPEGVLVGPSGAAFRLSQGTRAEIDRIVGTNIDDRAALARILKGEGDWNRERLIAVYGPERGKQLFDLLDNEAAMAATEEAVLGAAGRRANAEATAEVNPAKRGPGATQEALNLRPGAAGAKLLDDMFGGHAHNRQSKANSSVAGELMGRGEWQVGEKPPISTMPVPMEAWLADLLGRQEDKKQPPISGLPTDLRELLLRL